MADPRREPRRTAGEREGGTRGIEAHRARIAEAQERHQRMVHHGSPKERAGIVDEFASQFRKRTDEARRQVMFIKVLAWAIVLAVLGFAGVFAFELLRLLWEVSP